MKGEVSLSILEKKWDNRTFSAVQCYFSLNTPCKVTFKVAVPFTSKQKQHMGSRAKLLLIRNDCHGVIFSVNPPQSQLTGKKGITQ